MRITNGMMVTNMLRDITRNQERMDALNKNLASGKKFLKPSDDPLGVSKSLRLNTDLSTIEQFQRNVEDSQSWLSSTETATGNVIDILQRVRELTVQGANGTNSTAERGAISSEVEQLKEQLIHVGNSSYAGSYLFSGYKTDKPLLNTDGTYDLGGLGQELNSKEIMDVNLGIGDKFGLNFVGQRIFGVMKSATDLDLPISQGVFDYTLKGSMAPPDPIGVIASTAPNHSLVFNYGSPATAYNFDIPVGGYSPDQLVNTINTMISTDPTLANLKNHVSANVSTGRINIVSDEPFEISSPPLSETSLLTQMGMDVNPKAVMEKYTIESGTVGLTPTSTLDLSSGTNGSLVINYGSSSINVALDPRVYDGSAGNDLQDIANQIQAKINTDLGTGNGIVVQVKNNQLYFNSDLPITIKEDSLAPINLNALGLSSGKTSTALGKAVKSGEETQLVGMLKQLIADLGTGNQTGIGGALKRLDMHLDNINAVRSEIGVKTNRLELTANRISDDTLNIQTLLSVNEDADMAEVIMNLKMEENVYKSSLSGGARIIQPSLLDFLR